MYNGIGLQTARGSGTNGHVQRNFAFVRAGKKDNTTYKTEEDLKKMDALNNRPPNQDILEHERKRKIEVKCIEFEEILEDQNYTPEEIAAKVQSFREKLLMQKKDDLPKDEFGRVSVRETHQVAAAQQEKNEKLRSAFGISEYFVDGSSFDVDRKGKEEVAKGTALQEELEAQRAAEKEKNKRYKLVRTPSREKEVEPKPEAEPSDKKKSKDKRKSKKKKDEKSAKSGRRSEKRKRSKSTDSSSSDDSSDTEEEKKKKIIKKKSSKKGGDDKDSGKKKRDSRKSKVDRRRKHSSEESSSSSSSSDSSSSSESEKDRKRSKGKRSRKRKSSDTEDSTSSSESSGRDRKQRRKWEIADLKEQ